MIYTSMFIFTDDEIKKINSLYSKKQNGDEFEASWKGDRLTQETFTNIIKYISGKATGENILEKSTTLDVNLNKDITEGNYRLSINGIETINSHYKTLVSKTNNVIYKILLSLKEGVSIMNKVRREKPVDIADYNLRFKLSGENSIKKDSGEYNKLLKFKIDNSLTFRYKQRASLIIVNNKINKLRIDVTDVKQSNIMKYLPNEPSEYELEFELLNGTLDDIYKEIEYILKIIQQSNYILRKSEIENVVTNYMGVMSPLSKKFNKLIGRKPITVNISNFINHLPTNYAVTDKADGERYQMIIYKKNVYMISTGLLVHYTGITLDNDKYNNTIMDGELIFIKKFNRFLYMVFDVIFSGNEHVHTNNNFLERLAKADEIINNCFVNKKHKYEGHHKFTDKFNVQSYCKFYETEISTFLFNLNHDMSIEKNIPLIRRKLFIPVIGVDVKEIYIYSVMLWEKYVVDKNSRCPYNLDGLIYHPLIQSYEVDPKLSKRSEFKWKPGDKNSIDFYITFERYKGNELIVYDKTVKGTDDDETDAKPYKICNLHVGNTFRGEEKPVLFRQEEEGYHAHIYLRDGDVRDIEGNIIQDKTVVEFYYNNDPDVPPKFRWVPLKTRYDKTEFVRLHKQQYGNNINIANIVWQSMIHPITMTDFKNMANDDIQDKHKQQLTAKSKDRYLNEQDRTYYEFKTVLAQPMRSYHNWIKDMLIYTYCNNEIYNRDKMTILDIGCGRGGDMDKFYRAGVKLYVGVEPSFDSLFTIQDSAMNRYMSAKKKNPNYPPMYFIQADATSIFNYNNQIKVLGGMSKKNAEIMNTYMGDEPYQFDIINSSLAMHYFLEDETKWNNFCENISRHLKIGGFFLATCTDAQQVLKLLDDKDKVSFTYLNQGELKTLYEIVKKGNYDKKTNITTGFAIDIHNSIISAEGKYITEYLVDKSFVQKELKKKCGLRLVDTDLFENQLNLHQEFFMTIPPVETNKRIKLTLEKIAEYYQNTNINNQCKGITATYRYYAFQRL